jgi:pimeloyl-ACP methyl ester carboxylesterase
MRFTILFAFCQLALLARAQVTRLDHFVSNATQVPGFQGQNFQIYLREKIPTAALNQPGFDFSGKVVLMVHGFSVPGAPVFDFEYQGASWMDFLANQGYDVFALDLTGYGASTRPAPMADSCNLDFVSKLGLGIFCTKNYPFKLTTTASEIDDLEAVVGFIKNLRNVQKINLVGHSMGGGRVLLYAAGHPGEVEKIIVHGFAGANLPPGPPAVLPPGGDPMAAFGKSRIEDWAAGAGCFDQLDPVLTDEVWAAIQATDPVAANWGPNGCIRYPLGESWGLNDDTLATIEQPVLVLAGENDDLADPFFVTGLYNDLTTSNKVMLEILRISHTPYWERRNLDLYALCADWLDDTTIDGHTTGRGIVGLNDDIDWIGEPDDTAPPLPDSLYPANGASFVPSDADLTLVLDEPVFSPDRHLTVLRAADYSVFQYVEMKDTSRVNQLCSNVFTIDLDPLEPNTEYLVYVHWDVFRDRSFNYFEGLLCCDNWRFSTGQITASNEVAAAGWKVFPNPAQNVLFLEMPPHADLPEHLQLFNASGQPVSAPAKSTSYGWELDVAGLPGGLYVAKTTAATLRFLKM